MTTTAVSPIRPHLMLTDADKQADLAASRLPDGEELAQSQTDDAIARIREDSSDYPRFPIADLDALAGCHAPDELWIWLGRQGNGKSLAMQNLAKWNMDQGIATLYIGTEQDAHVLRIKQACVIVGANPRLILKPRPAERDSAWWSELAEKVEATVLWLLEPEQRALLVFANTRYVNRKILSDWVSGSVRKYQTQFVIVDHIDHMDHGSGQNAASELKASVQLLKDLACRHHICVMAASQVKRAGDVLKNYTPPEADDAFGSSAKEQTADVMLSCWRPLRNDMSKKDLRALTDRARDGHVAGDTVYRPNTMGVRLVKDRLGDAPGKQAMLTVDHGRLLSLPEKDRYTTDTATRGQRP